MKAAVQREEFGARPIDHLTCTPAEAAALLAGATKVQILVELGRQRARHVVDLERAAALRLFASLGDQPVELMHVRFDNALVIVTGS